MADETTFDYIICGGGTSGCVIAGRLAEDPDVNVLVIEAGDHSDNVPATKMVGGIMTMFGGEHDWCFQDEGSPGLNGRKVVLGRGNALPGQKALDMSVFAMTLKVLGGSSAMNGSYAVRGPKLDYDDWDLPGWSGDEVYRYMSKAETFVGDTKDIAVDSHGHTGPLLTARHPDLEIDKRVLKSFISQGLPWTEDPFTTGENPHCTGPVICTVSNGVRSTSAAWLTEKNLRTNVTIKTKAVVDKVNFSKENPKEPRAVSVSVILADKTTVEYKARHEIILSAGSYCSPPILLRSGIGPKAELEKHGIPVVLDSPGVGKNLQDHLLVYQNYEVSEPGLTTDHQIWHEGGMAASMGQYAKDRTGFLANFFYNPLAYARLDSRLEDSELWRNADRKPGRDPMGLDPARQPSVELLGVNCFMAGGVEQMAPPVDGSFVMSMIAMVFGLQSRGSVSIRSTDPNDKPLIDNNYLANDLDALVLAEGCRFNNEIVMQGTGTKDMIKGSWPRDRDHHTWTEREPWIKFVRERAVTSYHPCSTCSMGKDDNPDAVLDPELRVRGVRGLRVADVSVIPTNVQAHTQMIAYGIGEKAADLIRAARRK
ncbi:Oxygen-dependent choline dehydrogenase [Cyphellophora attinorum]|uniref:Oxygen-dependent choline dehydrogenase n=1 Tax=Cyphellophora attinorum TaxID=1664694 RepID=A0A0N1GXT1_9EURO|nr:Oxygen-dependent choline dehydrogenase [Phialophora attinorum]KPI35277.1 Oxygen-dependent choline dehydrogenase [Phialophora attinorum]